MPASRTARQRFRGFAVAFGAAAVAFWIGTSLWAGTPVTWSRLLGATVAGVALGAIYALAATGLVVTYTTSGIFNFAQGAIGMLMAFVYWQLTQGWGLAEIPALLLVVLVLAPTFGVLLDRFAMRRAARSSLVVQLMATVALMLFLMGFAAWVWNQNESRSIPYLFGNRGFHVGDTVVLWHRFITIVLGVAIAIALRMFLKRSRIGLAMRAVVDSPTLAALHGAKPERASGLAWAMGSSLAALAGILLAPEVLMSIEGLTLLIVNAFAAAIIGRLRSLPLTVAGGLFIGLLSAFSLTFLDFSGRWSGVPQAIPTLVLFVALLALPSAPITLGRKAARMHTRVPKLWEAALGGFVLVLVLGVAASRVSVITQNRLTSGVLVALVLIPLVPLIGWSGQVALAPLTFAGIGAYYMVAHNPRGNLLGLIFAALLAIPVGALIALPALRLQGLYFALASVAFARATELIFFAQPDVLGSRFEVVQRPEVFGISFKSPLAFLVLCAIFFAMIMVGLVAFRTSKHGRRLIAMRDSSAACTTIGLDIRKLKLEVFCLSAGLGAVAGGLLAMQRGTPSATDFGMFPGLAMVLFLVMGGVTLLVGALFAGWANFLFAWFSAAWTGGIFTAISRMGPGGLAGGVSQNPNGIAGEISKGSSQTLPWRGDARQAAAAEARKKYGVDPTRLGIEEPFTDGELRRIDDRLGVPAELRTTN
jgi:branched-chain amino acid transport system permease protein